MGKYKCAKCNKEYDTSEIRFSGSNTYTCVYCLGLKKKEIISEPVKKEAPKEEMVEYICSGCNYSFKRKKSFKFNSCPYCNKQGTVSMKKSLGADKIISESTDRRYDF